MAHRLSRSRSYVPHETIDSWTPSKYSNKYTKMGMATPPRPRKEFTGGSIENRMDVPRSAGGMGVNRRAASFDDDRNPEGCHDYDDGDFIGSAREYVSRMREGPRSAPRLTGHRSLSEYDELPPPPPRYTSPHGSPGSNAYNEYSNNPSKYEIMGMKEQLKKNEATRLHLEEALESVISEKVSLEQKLRDEMSDLSRTKEEEMERLHKKYTDEALEQRSKLVETFKDDMMEMKAEWENAFARLRDEADATKRALLQELESASDAKVEMETRLGEVTAEYKSRLEEERDRAKERMEEMKKGKEQDLERLREMYEEHLQNLKNKQDDERKDLKDEIQILLEENEKIKVCYENLEEEMERAKRELNDMNVRCQAAVSDNVKYEKEVSALKDEVDDLLDENEKLKRTMHDIQGEMKDVKMEMERVSKENGRIHSELNRVNREFGEVEHEKNTLSRDYKELVKKIETIEEERELESRYTEALAKQRDNMNAIIENCQVEIEELKESQREAQSLRADFGDVSKELDEKRAELKKMEGVMEELAAVTSKADSLQRERERYNATVKALKVDLRALHQESAGSETSLQEHMRMLNEKWQESSNRLKKLEKLDKELTKSMELLEEGERERERMGKEYEGRVESLTDKLEGVQKELIKVCLCCFDCIYFFSANFALGTH